jgi:hypothetical protein
MGNRFLQLGLKQPAAIFAALVLASCQSSPPVGLAKTNAEIAVLRLKAGDAPPQSPGKCWASDTSPAVIETITEHVQVLPERRDGAGNITQAAQFQTRTAQRMVSDRAVVWFASPCPDALTVGFVASLQRALKARGRFFAPVTGAWDAETLAALQKFQRERGLDSPVISLAAAQELGLVAADL